MLLIGPPGSGKTHFVLEQIETAVREGRGDEARLVVPTVSMARHTLHTLARRAAAVAADTVTTLADFITRLTPEAREPSPALSAWLLEQVIAESGRAEFAALGDATGPATAAARTMREFWAAGCDSARVAPLATSPAQQAFAEVFHRYEECLGALGYVSPWGRFQLAAAAIRAGALGRLREVYLDGFFHLTAGERELIQAVADTVEKPVVTLIEDPRPALERLPIRRLEKIHRPAVIPTVSEATTPTQEIEEIARVILDERAGRPGSPTRRKKGTGTDFCDPPAADTEKFRARKIGCQSPIFARADSAPELTAPEEGKGLSFAGYGVVLRSPEAYAPIICRVFERFGIPFRLRRAEPLSAHASVRFLPALLQAAQEGFPAEKTLMALRHPACAGGEPGELDTFDFEVRRHLPGRGLSFLELHAKRYRSVTKRLAKLREFASSARESLPPPEWAERVREFHHDWWRRPEVGDGADQETSDDRVLTLRSAARAVVAFRTAAEEAAALLSVSGDREVPLSGYLRALEFVLRRTAVAPSDNRRDVVQVLSIFEARQWELPVVFVPGLVEGQFPRRPERDLFFNESDRERLRRNGIPLRSTEAREAEERLLFRVASTRAREKLFLSHARLDEQSRPLLRSFFLETAKENDRVLAPIRLREQAPDYAPPSGAHIRSPELRQWIVAKHESFSPTSLERFLQCPFQYFARRTLRLEEAPPAPEDRLDALVEGNIVHRAMAMWSKDRARPILEILREVFELELNYHRIPKTFRTLAALYRIEDDLERFCSERAAGGIPGATGQGYEVEFDYLAERDEGDNLLIKGRVDRFEVLGEEHAFVVDYKYSGKQQINDLVRGHDQGHKVQGSLYLLGLEKELGLRPAGMQFWGLRGETTRRGWVVEGRVPEEFIQRTDIKVTENNFRGILNQGRERALDAMDEIRDGRIEVAPRDREECNSRCNFRDLCRIQL